MNDTPRIDWLRRVVWTALFAAAALLILGACGWLFLALESVIAKYGPWLKDHAALVAGIVILAGVVAIGWMARKDNPSW